MKIGIYFQIEGVILIDSVLLADGEHYGEAIQYGGHYEFWEKLRPSNPLERRFKVHAYDYYPRGRVVYFPERGVYRLYSDRCLTAVDLSAVVAAFGLAGHRYEVVSDDEHYRCAKCNPHFME